MDEKQKRYRDERTNLHLEYEGKILLGIEAHATPQLMELSLGEVAPDLKKEAAGARKAKKSDLISI